MAVEALAVEPTDGALERLLTSLSPSRAMDFRSCPQLYKYRVVDRLPEPANPAALRGTLVHAVLERLFDVPAPERTLAAAIALLPQAWADVRGQVEVTDEGVDEVVACDDQAWLASAHDLLHTYFDLEDPRHYEPAARELAVEVQVSDGLLLRGIIDRLDEASDGRVRVVDYKTGRSPSPDWESRALFQLRFYALVLWRLTGTRPSVLRLMYLGDGVILEHSPDEADLVATERLLGALHDAIRTAHDSGRFEAAPGPRCRWCSFADRCPDVARNTGAPAPPD